MLLNHGDYITVWTKSDGLLRFYGTYKETTESGCKLLDYSEGLGAKERTVSNSLVFIKRHESWAELEATIVAYHKTNPITPPTPEPTAPKLVIAVTGHRPDKLGGYNTPNPLYDIVVKGLVDAFTEFKPDYVISGMALGVDQWTAEVCINMQIPFIAALPFRDSEKKWPPKSQAKFHWLLSQAYQKYVICDGGFEPWKMQKRNEWMVDSCHKVVAVWNGTTGGTANCLAYATARGKDIYYVPLPPPGMEVGQYFEKVQKVEPPKPASPLLPGGDKRIVEI